MLIFLFSILILFIFNFDAFSQRKADIGFFAGTAYYMGDLNPSKFFYAPSVAIGPIYRYNFDFRNSVRLSGIYHSLRANDLDFDNPLQQLRGENFTASFMDMTAVYEFNFIPYKTADRKKNQAVFTSVGIGYHLSFSGENHVSIPFSAGYKFNLGKKLSAGLELTSRKTFTDNKIDGFMNPEIQEPKFHLVGNNDWYTFAGIFVTYKIFNYRDDCPTYD
ncbi:MAG: DUF6089 family protein [Bacteroidales bacterium]|nr:DUF6089 family protein [Bacteroidales bacterium]